MPVAEQRFNVLAFWGEPIVTFSTHIDTVPPFFASREDDDFIWGRGACDTKGIISAMIHAVEGLLVIRSPQPRPAVRRRRGAQQRRSLHRCEDAARIEVPHQWRADGEQARARVQRRAAVTRLSRRAAWRTRRIPSSASRPSRNFSMRCRALRQIELAVDDPILGPAR